jgi:hypothetical protein
VLGEEGRFGGELPCLTASDGCGKEKSSTTAKLLVGLTICGGVLFGLGSLVVVARFAVGIFVGTVRRSRKPPRQSPFVDEGFFTRLIQCFFPESSPPGRAGCGSPGVFRP